MIGIAWEISDAFQWIPTQGHDTVVQPEKNYIHQLCAFTGCRLEDLPIGINGEKESREFILSAHHHYDDDFQRHVKDVTFQ